MDIQTSSFYVSRVRADGETNLADFVKSDKHLVAVSSDIGNSIGLRPAATVTVPSGDKLQAVPTASSKLTAGQRLAIEKAALTFGSATLPLLKKYVPNLTGAIDGIECCLCHEECF
jgi:hypothetical protein